MQHKYSTTALVLARSPHGEANASLMLLTNDLGLIRVRAQGIRKPGAKLAPAVQTLAEADVTLVRAKDGWRLTGALTREAHATRLTREARTRVGRVAELLTRFVQGESTDGRFFGLLAGLIEVLPTLAADAADAAECLAVLRLLAVLGLDAGALPDGAEHYGEGALEEVSQNRSEYIKRINRGIEASGL